MKKRMRQKIPKFHSKKGMSLVELVVGITIIVIVFSSTLTAMTQGFTNTLYNALVNQTAAEGGSLHEMMMEAAVKMGLDSKSDAEALYTTLGVPTDDNTIHNVAKSVVSDIEYVAYAQFPKAGVENQYTLNMDAESSITKSGKTTKVKGMEIQTLVTSVKGTLVNRSFIAYVSQS